MADGRVVGNWLRAYAEYTKESESPDSYHLWTALSVIASAVRRRVWLSQKLYTLFPHLFVVLVGPARKVAKSTSIRLGRKLLLGVEGIVFGPDSVTREELIREMAKIGKNTNEAAMTIHSTELSSLIEPSGIKMIQFLTDIYDGDFQWRYATKGRGKDTIVNPVLNILAGTTPSWIAEGLPANVTGHGFTARVIFVYEDNVRFLNPRPGDMDVELIEGLIEDLNTIASLEGPFSMTPEAEDLYDYYYRKVYETTPNDPRIEGFHWAKAKVNLPKVAMLLSLAESNRLVIEARDIEAGWNLLTELEPKMHRTFSAVGKYEHASDLERMFAEISQNGGLTAEQIHQKFYSVGDVEQIARMLTMLIKMNWVERVREGDKVVYRSVRKP